MLRKTRAVWRGSGRAGNGDLSSDPRLAQDAEHHCPVSRVLRAEIALDAKLV
jgi:organic hydroperoxide reductase OsmC/OhrA